MNKFNLPVFKANQKELDNKLIESIIKDHKSFELNPLEYTRQIVNLSATLYVYVAAKTSAGVLYPRHLRGLLFIILTTISSSS